jgi:hypothetical protein
MAASVQDIVVAPNCDMHVAMTGAPQLQIKVFERIFKQDAAMPGGEDKRRYELTDVTASCTFTFFAPYEPVGSRLTPFVSIDNTGNVTPTGPGINLVHIFHTDANGSAHYMIVRVQVHSQVLGWWFGIPSLTVAKDDAIAHTQVSIYALFSDDAKKTDLVGDITGHGYVNLTSSNNTVFEPHINKSGRIWGRSTGTGILTGNFLGVSKNIPVKVIDYAQQRNVLDPVQYVKPFAEAHNMLFIPEGFRDTADDREKFNKIVTELVDKIFHKPRHSPYNILQGSFNVFKVFEPSNQHVITSGCGINDEDDPRLPSGFHVPYINAVSSIAAIPYTPEELIMNVGLPLRNETRTPAQLKALWASQSLPNYNAARVDDDLISVWKKQRSLGILEARDTVFGFNYGQRYADRGSGFGSITVPATDSPSAALSNFIKRLYEWFYAGPTRLIVPDPRRHPPEVHRDNQNNPSNIVMQYISGLHYMYDSTQHIGQEWIPDVNGNTFKPSVGFIGVIVNDGIHGGGNLNSSTMTTTAINSGNSLAFQYVNTATEKILRRNPPNNISEDIDEVIDVIAHEFGHSFNLGDEYESFPDDDAIGSDQYDNIANLTSVQLNSNFMTNRLFDPDKIKWFDLLRIDLASKLVEDSTTDGGNLKVKINPQYAGKWSEAKTQNKTADIRKPQITSEGRQLPLVFDDAHYLVRLEILNVDATNGFVTLGGPELPSPPLPVFPKGSFIFVPLRDSDGNLIYVVEKKVLNFLKNDATNKNLPLNKDADRARVNDGSDDPKDIPDFKPACKAYKTIGAYEGANYHTGMQYRPAGNCKMRVQEDTGGGGEFCHVCKYLIVNRVDPEMHDVLDKNHYPKAKKS